jgi:hypothetical protein
MGLGLSAATANAILDAIFRSVAYSDPAAVWVKLHIGDPGAAGTSNPAVNTQRVQGTFASAASGGSIANTSSMLWPNVPASEDYTHFSIWDASVAGNFIFSGTVVANPVVASDDFLAQIGAFTGSLVIAS